MPSRAVTSFLRNYQFCYCYYCNRGCQCPLGLLPHFYVITNFATACVAYNKSTRYRRQNSPVSEREFLKIGKGHVEAK